MLILKNTKAKSNVNEIFITNAIKQINKISVIIALTNKLMFFEVLSTNVSFVLTIKYSQTIKDRMLKDAKILSFDLPKINPKAIAVHNNNATTSYVLFSLFKNFLFEIKLIVVITTPAKTYE